MCKAMLLHRLSKAYSNLLHFHVHASCPEYISADHLGALAWYTALKEWHSAFNLIQATLCSFADHRLPEDQSQLHIFSVFHNLLHC